MVDRERRVLRSRDQIERIMRRIGRAHQIPAARKVLPEVVDLDRDANLLQQFGLSVDRIVDELGGGPW
jgi:hypothetical protein